MAEEGVAVAVAAAEPAPAAEISVKDALKAVLLKARIHDGLKRGLHECVTPLPIIFVTLVVGRLPVVPKCMRVGPLTLIYILYVCFSICAGYIRGAAPYTVVFAYTAFSY